MSGGRDGWGEASGRGEIPHPSADVVRAEQVLVVIGWEVVRGRHGAGVGQQGGGDDGSVRYAFSPVEAEGADNCVVVFGIRVAGPGGGRRR